MYTRVTQGFQAVTSGSISTGTTIVSNSSQSGSFSTVLGSVSSTQNYGILMPITSTFRTETIVSPLGVSNSSSSQVSELIVQSSSGIKSSSLSSLITSLLNKSGNSDNNCLLTESNGRCSKCIAYYFLDENKNCQKVSPLCVKVNELFECQSCLEGYQLQGHTCLPH